MTPPDDPRDLVRPLSRRTPSGDKAQAQWQPPIVDAQRLSSLELPAPVDHQFTPVMRAADEGDEHLPAMVGGRSIDEIPAEWAESKRATLTPRSAAHRVAFRLTGVAGVAAELSGGPTSSRLEELRSLAAAVDAAIDWHAATDQQQRRRMEDPHWDHRVRLVRELRRWSEPERAILAARFLADRPVSEIAATLDNDDAEILAVTCWWDSADVADVGMLSSIDQWTNTLGARQPDASAPAGPLAHLDDLYEPVGAG